MDISKITSIDVRHDDGQLILSSAKSFLFPKRYEGGKSIEDLIILRSRHLPIILIHTPVKIGLNFRGGDSAEILGAIIYSDSTQLNIKLVDDSRDIVQDKRRFFKITAQEACLLRKFERDTITYRYLSPVTATILDINIGGVFLIPDIKYTFETGDIIHLDVKLIDVPLETRIKVIRKQILTDEQAESVLGIEQLEHAEDNEINEDMAPVSLLKSSHASVCGYGCVFVGLKAGEEDKIAYYINRCQIIKRHKKTI